MATPKGPQKPNLVAISKLHAIELEAAFVEKIPLGVKQSLGRDARIVTETLALELEMARIFNEKTTSIFNAKAAGDDDLLRYERECCGDALMSISKFFKQLGVSQSYAKLFYRLAAALGDLNQGTVDPLLAPVRTRKNDHTWLWCARARISLGVFALRETGLTRRDAAKKAAREFPGIKGLSGMTGRREPTSTETKILSWLDGFYGGKIQNRQAMVIFSAGKQDIEQLCSANPEILQSVADRALAAHLQAIPEKERLRAAANMHFTKALQMIVGG